MRAPEAALAGHNARNFGSAPLDLNLLVKRARRIRRPAPIPKTDHFEYPNAPIKGDRHHITGTNQMTCTTYPRAIEANTAGMSKTCGCGARSHDTCVPEPFVDPLSVSAQVV
jgi:hypothetical protein